MYNPLLNITLPVPGDLSHDFLLLSGAGELFPKGDDHSEVKAITGQRFPESQALF